MIAERRYPPDLFIDINRTIEHDRKIDVRIGPGASARMRPEQHQGCQAPPIDPSEPRRGIRPAVRQNPSPPSGTIIARRGKPVRR